MEQCFVNLTDLFHFAEQGPALKQLTESEHMVFYFTLLLNCSNYPYFTIRIFKQFSAFFKEVTSDNPYLHSISLESFETFYQSFVSLINEENSEFITNLAFIYYNLLFNLKGFQSIQANFKSILHVIDKVFESPTP